jgi:hypothetical protein
LGPNVYDPDIEALIRFAPQQVVTVVMNSRLINAALQFPLGMGTDAVEASERRAIGALTLASAHS